MNVACARLAPLVRTRERVISARRAARRSARQRLIGGMLLLVALAGCKDERLPDPRWVHKAAEIDRETWGRDCGPGATMHSTRTGDLWSVPGRPGEKLSTLCALEWVDDRRGQVQSIDIRTQQETLDPSQAEAAFQRALPVLMREIPEEVQREVKSLVEKPESRKVRIRGFTVTWQYLQQATRAERVLRIVWDPQRIY